MAITDKQLQLAEKIDTWIKGIEKRGGSDEDILKSMSPYMSTFQQLMKMSSKDDMNALTAKYAGFYRFAKVLENLASGLQNGSIQVPKK